MNEKKVSGGILVLIQTQGRDVHPVSKKTAEIAAALSIGSGCPLSYLKVPEEESPSRCGALLSAAIGAARPDVVMAGSTPLGKIAASIAAVQFNSGIAADCTELILEPDMSLLQKRPAFGGNVTAWVRTGSRPQIVTVRPDIVSGETRASWADFLRLAVEITPEIHAVSTPGYRNLEVTALPRTASIEDAELIIALGGGVASKETVQIAAKLAAALGGELAGSRALVQRGFLPPERQIGLSGRAVSPRLLITLGISGSQQFLAGIGGCDYLIAVNTDASAPILSKANLPILCDLNDVLQNMEQLLKSAAPNP